MYSFESDSDPDSSREHGSEETLPKKNMSTSTHQAAIRKNLTQIRRKFNSSW